MFNRVTKDLSRGSYGGELEAIMESYVQCYTFIITMTLGDTDDDNSFVQQLIVKVCSGNLIVKTLVTHCVTWDNGLHKFIGRVSQAHRSHVPHRSRGHVTVAVDH